VHSATYSGTCMRPVPAVQAGTQTPFPPHGSQRAPAHLEHLTGCFGAQLLSVAHPFNKVLPSEESLWHNWQLSPARQRAQLRQEQAARDLRLGHWHDIVMTRKRHDTIYDFKFHAKSEITGVSAPWDPRSTLQISLILTARACNLASGQAISVTSLETKPLDSFLVNRFLSVIACERGNLYQPSNSASFPLR
jgi:hypothetical protein